MICIPEWFLFLVLLVTGFLSAYIGYTTRCSKESTEVRIKRERILLSKIEERDRRIAELEKELTKRGKKE